jgi:hypothetical protein
MARDTTILQDRCAFNLWAHPANRISSDEVPLGEIVSGMDSIFKSMRDKLFLLNQ